MSGFVTNPMEHAESSLLAIYGVASYAWNPDEYDSDKAWKDAMKAILPGAAKELETFATHNSDLGANGHGYRREESVALKPVAERFLKHYQETGKRNGNDFLLLLDTFQKMQEAADILMANTENPALINEMRPWLIQHKLIGELGERVLWMMMMNETGDAANVLRYYKHAKALQQQIYTVDQTYNQNPYQPGVKTAGLVIKPLIDQLFAKAVALYNEKHNAQLDGTADYMPHKMVSDVNQLKHIPMRQRGNNILVSPANEVIKWQAKGSMTIELDKVYPVNSISFDFGKLEIAAWGKLEISNDGTNWFAKDFAQTKNRIDVNLGKAPVKFVRFTNVSDQEQEVYLRQFSINVVK
jgi:hyaluronoglucosaminidase